MKGKIRKINELLVNKEISATELLNKYIDYTEKYNPTLNAYINTTYDEAFKYAQKADDIIIKVNPIKPPIISELAMHDNNNIRCFCSEISISLDTEYNIANIIINEINFIIIKSPIKIFI